jgi:hypothetical protein
MASRYSSQSGMLAGDAAEIVDEAVGCLRHVQHLGVAVDLHPRAVPVVGEDEHRDRDCRLKGGTGWSEIRKESDHD